MNAWLPQASYPCGNFSDTYSFEFQRFKGSLGHDFMDTCIIFYQMSPQPNSPPDNVFRLDWVVDSELVVQCAGMDPEGTIPSPSPSHHMETLSYRGGSSSSPLIADGFGTGTSMPRPQSQSFSPSYESILPTSLAYFVPSTKGCSSRRPDAVMSITEHRRHLIIRILKGGWECTRNHAMSGALQATRLYL
ncbi:hypothetical protein CQW23_35438 [Capsicum baccatum]|uniref:Regulator of rDNA transcription protein 15 n=1 Tax=Capsicum baccatum TaxID=33114 RepID=A0A2G2UW06_CAPBA|nr:hypothetical protein CQW23_35438 [Capsicum baccatum]